MEITYQALPFPMPEEAAQGLRQIAEKIASFHDVGHKLQIQKRSELQIEQAKLNSYIDALRNSIGVTVTRDEIRIGSAGQS